VSTSAVGGGTSAGLVSLRQQANTWWRSRSKRERQAVVLVVTVIVLFIVWTTFVQPAWRVAASAPAELDALDAQLQQMQRIAGESRALRGTAPVGAAQAGIALKAASDRLGDKARLNLQGDRAILTLTGVTPEALRAWLTEARAGARARPVEAQLQRGTNGYTGTVTVSFGGNS
jgi:general secretion pathway protein M